MSFKIQPYIYYSAEEILNLYESVGWQAYTQNSELLERAFKHSLFVLAAYEGDKLIGLIRTVGDGETIVFIQDLLVHPDHQRKGVGTLLIRTVLEHFKTVRQIQLITDNTQKTRAFYQSLGFKSHAEINCIGFMASK